MQIKLTSVKSGSDSEPSHEGDLNSIYHIVGSSVIVFCTIIFCIIFCIRKTRVIFEFCRFS